MTQLKTNKTREPEFERSLWYTQLVNPETDWEKLTRDFSFVAEMQACPQDPVFHAEGDVWTHTCMVVKALKASSAFAALSADRQQVLLIASLMHDIGKPATTIHEWDEALQRQRVRQPGHSRLGAHMAWDYLTRLGAPSRLKQDVYELISWHQRPFHIWTAKDMLRSAISYSLVGRWCELMCLVEADNHGRMSSQTQNAEENFSLLRTWLQEHDLLDQPWLFANAESRMQYFEKNIRSPYYAAQEEKGSNVVLLCGLAGAGKDTYADNVLKDYPQISLDVLRKSMGIEHGENQGAVIQAAYAQARVYLRAKKPFVWNATNITSELRKKVISLFRSYHAHVSIHVLDRPFDQIVQQNNTREAVIPNIVLERMLSKFEPPTLLEAHEVLWIE